MKKFVALLEQYCQWIALCLGGLWLVYMVWTNVLASTTGTVTVKGTELGPASIDSYVNDNAAQRLKDAMAKGETLKAPPLEIAHSLSAAFAGKSDPQIQLPTYVINTITGHLVDKTDGGKTPVPNQRLVNALPQPPAPIMIDVAARRSAIVPPGAVAAPGPGGNGAVRQLWCAVYGELPMADLDKAYQAVLPIDPVTKLPDPKLEQTTLLRVEVIREELLPGGGFGPPVTIASEPVDLNAPAGAAPPPAWPPQGTTPPEIGQQFQYIHWAALNQRLIAQPAFYQVTRGDGWSLPGQPVVQVGMTAPAAPAPVPQPPPPPPNPHRPPNPTRQGRSPRGSLDEPSLESTPIMADIFDENTPRPAVAPAAPTAPPIPPANAVDQAPAAMFVPSNANNIMMWVIDTKVEAGKTYRYSMRYTISNPIFGFNGVAAKPQLASQWSITSPLSQPSKSVTVPDTTSFYALSFWNPNNEVKFEIYDWGVNGTVKKTVQARPGDLIDDTLKLTFVDVRPVGPDGAKMMLVDESGNIIQRDLKKDHDDPQHRILDQQATAPAAPVAPR